MSEQYKNPPFVEAYCEFTFEPGTAWNWTVPGLFYGEISKEFPVTEEVKQFQMQIAHNQSQGYIQHAGQPVTTIERLQFSRIDKSAMIQIAENRLVINHLVPYPGWKMFSELIHRALNKYVKIAKPKGIRSASLFYLNKIKVPKSLGSGTFELNRFVVLLPAVPVSIGENRLIQGYNQSIRLHQPGTTDMLTLHTALINPKSQSPENLDVALNINLSSDFNNSILQIDKVSQWIESAHNEVENAFLSCLGPEAQLLFNGSINVT